MTNRMDYLYQRKTVTKKHGDKTYICYDPKESISHLGYEFIEIIHDDNTYVLARIKRPQDKNPCLVVRWYIETSEYKTCGNTGKICKGYPNTRGYPTWFVLPDSILGDIQNYMLHHRNV